LRAARKERLGLEEFRGFLPVGKSLLRNTTGKKGKEATGKKGGGLTFLVCNFAKSEELKSIGLFPAGEKGNRELGRRDIEKLCKGEL